MESSPFFYYSDFMIQAAIFDMDGLLFDTERLCTDAWKNVSSERGFSMPDSLFRSCVGLNNRDTRTKVLSTMGGDFPYEEFADQTRTWMRVRMDENGPPEKPGIRALFGYLRDAGVPIGLATSTSEPSARWMIEKAGLESWFSAFAFGSEVATGKPAPDIFLLARDRLGVSDSSACVVFEDSPAGLRAAHAAGMRPVHVPDMVEVSPEIQKLVWKTISSLEEAAHDSFFRY